MNEKISDGGVYNLIGMAKELAGIGRIRVAENNGSSRHGGSRFSGEIWPWVARIDLVSVTVCGHVLWPLPTVVVAITVSYLIVKSHINNILLTPKFQLQLCEIDNDIKLK